MEGEGWKEGEKEDVCIWNVEKMGIVFIKKVILGNFVVFMIFT